MNLMNDNSKELYHHGILGMKWGVRRFQNEDGTLTEEGKKRYQSSYSKIAKKTGEEMHILTTKSKKYVNAEGEETIHEAYVNGQLVTRAYLQNYENSELNITYIYTKGKNAGRGYAQDMMDHIVDYAKSCNIKTISLEVPDGDDNARHIYEKYGFKEDLSNGKLDDILTPMKKQIN